MVVKMGTKYDDVLAGGIIASGSQKIKVELPTAIWAVLVSESRHLGMSLSDYTTYLLTIALQSERRKDE